MHVRSGNQTLMSLHVFNNKFGSLSFVEFVWSQPLKTSKSGSEIGLAKNIALVVILASVQINPLRFCILRQVVAISAQATREVVGNSEAVREPARRFNEIGPCQFSRTILFEG